MAVEVKVSQTVAKDAGKNPPRIARVFGHFNPDGLGIHATKSFPARVTLDN
jgi:hypothetical protein